MGRSSKRGPDRHRGLIVIVLVMVLVVLGVVWEFHSKPRADRPHHRTRKSRDRAYTSKVKIEHAPRSEARLERVMEVWPDASHDSGEAEFVEVPTVLVLIYNELPWPVQSPAECAVDCRLTEDRSLLGVAHGVVLNAPFLDHESLDDVQKTQDQQWVALCMGAHSDRQCKKIHAEVQGRIDLIASYKPGANIPVYSYIPPTHLLWRPTPVTRRPELVALLSSTCSKEKEPERFEFLTSLMSHLSDEGVASYGECFHNMDLPLHSDEPDPGDLEASEFAPRINHKVLSAIAQHKFLLVFENQDTPHYHTDKFWLGFQAGVVPVYWGSETILSEKFGPGPNSFVFAREYPTGKKLAARLKEIAADKKLYQSYFDWKRHNITAPYKAHKDNDASNFACNVCKKIVALAQ